MRSILQARREGPAFFDEDGACGGFIHPYAVCLNRYAVSLRSIESLAYFRAVAEEKERSHTGAGVRTDDR